MAFSDRELLARLIKCEAGGEGDDGMKAVATVVMNRVNIPYGEYARTGQKSIRKVIEQICQFSCYKSRISGQTNLQNIWNMNPEQIHYDYADWAIGGGKLWAVADCLWFLNPYSPNCPPVFPYNGTGRFHTRINNHCFYVPTELYRQT